RERPHLQQFERLAHDQRALDDARERRAGAGIEIEVYIVRSIHVVTRGVPLIQIDAAEIDDPQECGFVLDHWKVDHVPAAVIDPADLDPRRAWRRSALHEEERAGGAVRIPLHHHRAVADVRQERAGDVGVVLEKIAFRDTEIGPENLSQVGEANFPALDDHDDVVLIARDLHWGGPFRLRRGLPRPPRLLPPPAGPAFQELTAPGTSPRREAALA